MFLWLFSFIKSSQTQIREYRRTSRFDGNPTFDLTDSHSVIEAVTHARQLANTGYGEKNAEFARQNMNTELIAQKTILCYQQIYNLTLHENPTDR